MGEAVKPLTKGKLSAYAGPVEQMFSPAHVTMSFSQKHEIREAAVRDKVREIELIQSGLLSLYVDQDSQFPRILESFEIFFH